MDLREYDVDKIFKIITSKTVQNISFLIVLIS
jgi:hypothetical protein